MTFKQFIESVQFVQDPSELLPPRKVTVIDKQTGLPQGKEDNPEFLKQQQKDFFNFTRTSRLTPDIEKAIETDLRPDQTLKPVASGGSAKKQTLEKIGKYKKNIDFLGVYGHFYPGPEVEAEILKR